MQRQLFLLRAFSVHLIYSLTTKKETLTIQKIIELLCREEDVDLASALTETAKFLKAICKLDFVTPNMAKRAFGILQTNSVGLAPHGRALYPIVSIMSHSCVPNITSMLNPGEAIAFRANRVIEKDEELTIR